MKFFSRFKISMNPGRMKYQKNMLSYILCIAALFLDILTLSSLLGYPPRIMPDVRTGADVVCHIVFLMFCFMIAERTKAYYRGWAYGACIAGVYQVLRIFLFTLPYNNQGMMSGGALTLNIIYNLSAAACLIGAGIICYIRSALIKKHKTTEAAA